MARIRDPFSDFQRQVLYVIGRIESGDSPNRAMQRLGERVNATPGELQAVLAAAQGAIGAAVGASIQGSEAQLGDVIGIPAASGRVIAEATVEIRVPNAPVEYRTVRTDTLDVTNTVGDFERFVEAQIEEWNRKYGADGRTMTYSIRYLF